MTRSSPSSATASATLLELGATWSRKSPWSNETTWTGRSPTAEEISRSVERARAAQSHWSAIPRESREAIARRYADLLTEHQSELERLISVEIGKPRWEARTEIATATAKVAVSIEAIHQRRSTVLDQERGVAYRPLGVTTVLGPYNFPLHLPGSHIVPLLLAGNAVLFKPSELAPGVAEYMVRLWHQAGLPDDVLQCVQGGAKVAGELIDHSAMRGVFFTGSEGVGRAIHRRLAGRPEVLLALEMGGNNALIVMPTEAIDAAIDLTIYSCFVTSGQRCTCARRLILLDSPWGHAFLERLIARTSQLVVGLPSALDEPFMGPLVSDQAAQRVLDCQAAWIASGGIARMTASRLDGCDALITPGIIEIAKGVSISDEECFGPLIQVTYVADEDSAIAEVNKTRFGLSAGLIGGDETLFERFRRQVAAGVLTWNVPTTGASAKLPFGGVEASGNHRASAFFAADFCDDPIAVQSIREPQFRLARP